ncbi:MAG: NAD(P)H-dependent glycerol-3-phosphate dehydrogenase [Clostridia bacterium]|nr:NAD(P)H-dependent glycerol-3-phosphate dehydrogenase [Clostridia bacterium]
MKVTLLGCGRWGSFLAWYLHKIGHEMTVWGPAGDPAFEVLARNRRNDLISFEQDVKITDDLSLAVNTAQIVVISISSQALRGFAKRLAAFDWSGKAIVLCMKGLEEETGCRLTQIINRELPGVPVADWVGPGHVQEFTQGHPSCMVIDSLDDELKVRLVSEFSSKLIRFYYGTDLIGTEVGAATKNVVGIAAGMLDGAQLTSLKGALMARGTREIAMLIKAMGGNEMSAYGLAHLGDYEATVFSPHSHNRRFGEMFVRGEKFDKLAEGVSTAVALQHLGKFYGVEMPICRTVCEVLFEGKKPKDALDELFGRAIKDEF